MDNREFRASIASVGYIGWATLGGYGVLPPKYRLGVHQLHRANFVNAEGALIDAPGDELIALQEKGGCFGAITELTIKVYALKEVLEGTFAFESSNKQATWATFAEGYHKLISAGDFPNCLSLQPTGVAIPGIGNDYSVPRLGVDDDHEEGRKWICQIEALGTCVMNIVQASSWSIHCDEHEKMAGYGVYGRARTLNFKTLTPKRVEILAKYNNTIPVPGSLFSIQFHRAKGAHKNPYSRPVLTTTG
ncbi:hypothetical protein FOMG_18245 [Fusarium oxysporum f. sp. melonis 26406]|uniref:FAD linked oxidase N-terminal domain-containing protein n=1 Tax=Fusarium oxysporum f. sp. melonis 26406 TaxID=1089452 RepID=W9Z915_FUSOX|nr:hypothetical protein FOMG_18245 [Fusarium oxysporum f. sp. melonis 26406]